MKKAMLAALAALLTLGLGAQELERVPFVWKWLSEREVAYSYDGSFTGEADFAVDAKTRRVRSGISAPARYTTFPVQPAEAVNLCYSPDSTMLAFTRGGDLWTVEIATGEERRLTADAVLSSMPVRELMDSLCGVEIPEDVHFAARTLPYRDFITVGLLVKDLCIKNDTKRTTIRDRVPDCWIYVQDRDVKLGRVQIFNNWSPYMVQDPEGTVWMGLEYFCDEGDDLWSMGDEALIDMGKREIERIGIARGED